VIAVKQRWSQKMSGPSQFLFGFKAEYLRCGPHPNAGWKLETVLDACFLLHGAAHLQDEWIPIRVPGKISKNAHTEYAGAPIVISVVIRVDILSSWLQHVLQFISRGLGVRASRIGNGPAFLCRQLCAAPLRQG